MIVYQNFGHTTNNRYKSTNNATCDNVASKPPNIVAVIIPKNVRMMSQGNRLVAVFTTESFVESISDTD